MENMLDEETSSLKEGKVGNGTLMTSFVRALGVNQKGQVNSSRQTTQSPPKGLTIDEIFGNIFVINFAGHDTTANTLAFSMILLAAYPEVQDWVAEELKEVIKDPKDDILEYEKVFEKLNRCRAVLLETLRQFPPIMVLPKWSNDKPQIIQVEGKTIVIPSQTGVTSSVLAIQMYPKYWKDPLRWDLSRWVTSTSNLSSQISQLYAEKVINPANSTFFSWSDGPQNCPGQKFSQVEFIAVLAILLRDHRVNIVQNDGESPEEAKE
ncbi:hypothetical protein OCU04_002028 [Sclerotinia nivalis]|uniref:Cytochrome P450 n=1 Tax=Sclerotinia nivalis TaxID=352851 RepID=A0A9X0AZB6_9HELO|nr:hypothetical protein OCU04_002028 [Sclerotinia nivalis]